MSQENADLVHKALEAFNTRELDAMLALADPNCEWHSTFAVVGGAVYHGHDGLRRWHRDMEDAWEHRIRVEIESVFDLGEYVLSFAILHASGRHSGAEVAMPIAQVWKFRAGLVAYCKTYTDRDEALRDLGTSEDALQPINP
jgi:ketosteroid isomerase-like protein